MNLSEISNQSIKKAFIELALASNVLRFGNFTLKSGRQSPYFFNAGMFYHGDALRRVGQFYAQTLFKEQVNCQQLFGPAYKGLPLATATAIALAEKGTHCTVTFNRKEMKDHGEGGQLIGAPLQGDVVMIDDVISAGTAFRESKAIIEQNGGHLATVIIAMNRCEVGQGKQSAVAEIEAQGVRVVSIIDFYDLVAYLQETGSEEAVTSMQAYYAQYGENQR